MKRILMLLPIFLLSFSALAQHTIPLRTTWTKPQVHVIFEGYTISFTIKDIDRALQLLAETGDKRYGKSSGLDTTGDYIVYLFSGTRMEYTNKLQDIIQNGVGVFLLNFGHAYIVNEKNKRLKTILSDRLPFGRGLDESYYIFYDPKINKRLFTGKMIPEMKDKDLGIDY